MEFCVGEGIHELMIKIDENFNVIFWIDDFFIIIVEDGDLSWKIYLNIIPIAER